MNVDEVIKNVTKDYSDSPVSIDTQYQNEKWYQTTLTISRAVNLFLCAVLVFVLAGGV